MWNYSHWRQTPLYFMSETWWESSNRNSKKKCLLIITHSLLNENPVFCLQRGMSYISRRKPDLKQNPVIVVAGPISKPLKRARRKHKISSLFLFMSHSWLHLNPNRHIFPSVLVYRKNRSCCLEDNEFLTSLYICWIENWNNEY